MTQHAITGIDHAVIAVHDLDAAAAQFELLGFTVTARGEHTGLGSANRCIMFPDTYIELLAVSGDHPWTRFYREFLAETGEGVAALALQTPDAQAAFDQLTAQRFAPEPPLDFGRPVVRADGERDEARFRIVQIPPDQTPGGKIFACQHVTPELVYTQPAPSHRNSGFRVAGICAVLDPLPASMRRYERVFNRIARGSSNHGLDMMIGNALLMGMRREGFAKRHPRWAGHVPPRSRFVGITVQVYDLKAVASYLDACAIPWLGDTAIEVVVDPGFACGTMIEFI